LFYDFFSENPITIEETNRLVFGTRDAWFKQNKKENDLDFQRLLEIKMYSVVPYCAKNSSKVIYRILYSAGLKGNDQQLDITDFIDPSDSQYSSSLGDKLELGLDRTGYNQYMIPCSVSARSIDDIVVGVSYWNKN
jgi:hypothetical protein